jgi:hypothetical protein
MTTLTDNQIELLSAAAGADDGAADADGRRRRLAETLGSGRHVQRSEEEAGLPHQL